MTLSLTKAQLASYSTTKFYAPDFTELVACLLYTHKLQKSFLLGRTFSRCNIQTNFLTIIRLTLCDGNCYSCNYYFVIAYLDCIIHTCTQLKGKDLKQYSVSLYLIQILITCIRRRGVASISSRDLLRRLINRGRFLSVFWLHNDTQTILSIRLFVFSNRRLCLNIIEIAITKHNGSCFLAEMLRIAGSLRRAPIPSQTYR